MGEEAPEACDTQIALKHVPLRLSCSFQRMAPVRLSSRCMMRDSAHTHSLIKTALRTALAHEALVAPFRLRSCC